jgi:hypothetical protein
MSRRLLIAVAAVALAAAPSVAQAQGTFARDSVSLRSSLAVAFAEPAEAGAMQMHPPPAPMRGATPRIGSSAVLASLYVTTALMQGLDVHSTYRAIGLGGKEANPIMGGLTGNKGAFIATKAAMAAATIYMAHRTSKHSQLKAILTLTAINSVYAVVVDHNYRVARGLRR